MLLSQPESRIRYNFEHVCHVSLQRLRDRRRRSGALGTILEPRISRLKVTVSVDHQLAFQARQLQEHRERLSILEAALQGLEHQLRTPLAMIQLQAELLEHQNLPDQLNPHVHHIQTTIDSLQLSLKRLTQCGLGGTLQRQSCDLRSLVVELMQELAPALEAGQLDCQISPDSCWLEIDTWQIRQALQNILTNAIAFSPKGTQIRCQWTMFQNEVVIQICDQGPGLAPEDLQHIFKPFYSKRPSGSGLGLAIAHKIILDHHGSLWAENLPEGGAQFCLVLPFLKSSGSASTQDESDSIHSQLL